MALILMGRVGNAKEVLDRLQKILKDESLESVKICDINRASDLLAIASEVLPGELAAADKKTEQSIDHLTEAVVMEDKLPFDEPPPWYLHVRPSLGAMLPDLGRAQGAESIFLKDLFENAENP